MSKYRINCPDGQSIVTDEADGLSHAVIYQEGGKWFGWQGYDSEDAADAGLREAKSYGYRQVRVVPIVAA